jgi:hypothetical protein
MSDIGLAVARGFGGLNEHLLLSLHMRSCIAILM